MTVHDDAWARVLALTKVWEDRLGMTGFYTIKHRRIDALGDPPYDGVIAETKAAWEYKQASILWHTPRVCSIDDTELEVTVVHELIHVLVASMESLITPSKHAKACEFAVQSVTDALLHALKGHE